MEENLQSPKANFQQKNPIVIFGDSIIRSIRLCELNYGLVINEVT